MSKWKLYKTARKRGIYAEIKKQNQQHALTKVPSNVQHFADMGVYKQLKKKTHLAKDAIFPHLQAGGPPQEGELRKVRDLSEFLKVLKDPSYYKRTLPFEPRFVKKTVSTNMK